MEILKQRLGRYKEVYSTREIREEIIDIIGDSNLDGEINSTDLQRLYTHLNGSNPIKDESQILCCDVNGDGNVNSTDLQRLYSHLNGSNPLE